MSYVNLHTHTEYSLKDSLVRVDALIDRAKELGMSAVSVCDSANLFASMKLFQKAMSKGVKPIISAELLVQADGYCAAVVLLAKDQAGYRNLIELISHTYEHGLVAADAEPIAQMPWLEKHHQGLICLTGGRTGLIGQALMSGREGDAQALTQKLQQIFKPGDLFIELQRIGHPDDDRYIHKAVRLAAQSSIPVVATNPVMFLDPQDFTTHEVRVAISRAMTVNAMRESEPHLYTAHQYLKSAQQMRELFSDIPCAIENTLVIARRCSVEIEAGKTHLPTFPLPAGQSESHHLNELARAGLKNRLQGLAAAGGAVKDIPESHYQDRLEFELGVINKMGFPGYFLIVADFIRWSKANDIPVGPGRGSGAGSLVAYAVGITDINPMDYDLLFERFLNPDRVSMPDFDVDFCMDRREEVIRYVSQKYGEDAVCQIVTFGTMAAKMVVRDVARSLGFPYAVGNRISNMIPDVPGTKLIDAIEQNTELGFALQTDPEVKVVLEHSLKLEGLTRQIGKHAGGVLIAPGKLTDFTATRNEIDKNGKIINKVSQLNMGDVELAGLVKFDFLGLKTLTIIQHAVEGANKRRLMTGEPKLDITNIPLDDRRVYQMLKDGLTTAVFQVESRGMKDLLRRMKPDCFEDIIALVALYRPGPLQSGMVDNFINRKHGREELAFPDPQYQHELLRPILEPTYGVILYQEQVMQIAQALAGYSLGSADLLRRAMGKKKPEEMAKQRAHFEQGAINNGIDGDLAIRIFDLVEKFAGYGFNKSHSAAYAMIAYQTAWLKVHYPAEFMAAVLSGDMAKTDKIVTYVNECRNMGIEILPPDVNKSQNHFVAETPKSVRYGLGAVKGIGASGIREILAERARDGEFMGLHDFCVRCTPKKTLAEAAIRSGALDGLGPHRASIMATYPKAISVGRQARKARGSELQGSLFGCALKDQAIVQFVQMPHWDDLTRLGGERKTLGLYLSGHPLEFYESEISPLISGKLVDLVGSDLEEGNAQRAEDAGGFKFEDKNVVIGGLIVDMEVRQNKRGQSAYLIIDDKSRQLEVMVFSKALHECQHVLEVDKTVLIEGKLKMDKRTGRVRLFASDIRGIDAVRERYAEHLLLDLTSKNYTDKSKAQLQSIIEAQRPGYAHIKAKCYGASEAKTVRLGDYEIAITDSFLNELTALLGPESVSVVYRERGARSGPNARQQKQRAHTNVIALGQRTFDERAKKMAELFDAARASMGF